MPSVQKSRRKRDTKRHTPPRGRKPESLQRFRYKNLQPWLDFAELVPFAETVPLPWQATQEYKERFLEEHAGLKPLEGESFRATRFPADAFFPMSLVMNRAAGAQQFFSFFWSVRTTLGWFIDSWARRDHWPSIDGQPAKHDFQWVPTTQIFSLDRSGLVSMFQAGVWGPFYQALQGLNIQRLRRCPICGRIYYAVRKDLAACPEHLKLARSRRERGKLPEYTASRRLRKKLGLKGSRGKQRQKLDLRSRALRPEDNNE
jgi:hypothetical protein